MTWKMSVDKQFQYSRYSKSVGWTYRPKQHESMQISVHYNAVSHEHLVLQNKHNKVKLN